MSVSLASRVAELLAPGGRIAAHWPRYEQREGQSDLARRIAETLDRGGVLLAEAPTGIGKSLAYLLPAVLLASEREQRVVIATCTRSLQDQLFERDIPALLAALGTPLTAVRLKGKQNYVCPRLLDLAEDDGPEERDLLDRLKHWAARDPEGDLDRFECADPEAYRRMRARVSADPNACTAATCRRGRECFWVRARRQAAQAPLVVVNHALLALSGEVEGLLPDFDVLIVDEAHRLEGVLLSQLERSVSRHRFEEALRLIGSSRAGARGGLMPRLRGYALPLIDGGGRDNPVEDELDRLARRVGECRSAVDTLFTALEPRDPGHPVYGTRRRYRTIADLMGAELEPLQNVLDHCAAFARSLHRLADSLQVSGASAATEELAAELEEVSARWAGLGADLDRLGDPSQRDWVYWRTAGGRGVELHGAPVTAGDHARRLVLSRARAAVLTSATLSTGGDFDFVAERLGLGERWGLPFEVCTQPSPFALGQQMRSFVHQGGNEESAVADLVAEIALATGRNQLVLFTAHERLRRARQRLLQRLGSGAILLAQDLDGPAGLLAERFRRERGAILLGVQSLWEGVDFPGEALEILVVAKLPFSVPDDPMVEARGERLRDRGLDPFLNDAVPEAVLRFRQGVGRLIRRADDRGVLVVCDPRLLTASYRRPFLNSLPAEPTPARDARELAAEAARFLAAEVPVEDET